MQINLSSTTHSLELETSVAGSVHYQLGYTDITATGVSLPQDEDGIITNRDRIRNMWTKIKLSKKYNSPLSIYDINVAYYS